MDRWLAAVEADDSDAALADEDRPRPTRGPPGPLHFLGYDDTDFPQPVRSARPRPSSPCTARRAGSPARASPPTPEVRAAPAPGLGLLPGPVQRRAVGEAARGLPEWCLRLEQARAPTRPTRSPGSATRRPRGTSSTAVGRSVGPDALGRGMDERHVRSLADRRHDVAPASVICRAASSRRPPAARRA